MEVNKNLLPIKRAALGRYGQIGDLYDEVTDNFTNENIFTKETLTQHIVEGNVSNDITTKITSVDSLEEKFKILQVEDALQFSIISGLLPLASGSGLYVTNEDVKSNCVNKSLIHCVKKRVDSLQLLPSAVAPDIDYKILESTKATHIVFAVEVGAYSIATVEASWTNKKHESEINENITSGLKSIQSIIEGGDNNDASIEILKDYSVTFVTDLPSDNFSLKTPEEIALFMYNAPFILEKKESAKPLLFHLISLSMLRSILNQTEVDSSVILINKNMNLNIKYLTELKRLHYEINQIATFSKENEQYFAKKESKLSNIMRLDAEIRMFINEKMNELRDNLISNRKGDSVNTNVVDEKIDYFNNCLNSLGYRQWVVKLIGLLKNFNGIYMQKESNIEQEVENVGEAFILFISESFYQNDKKLFLEIADEFISMLTNISAKFIVCNIDICTVVGADKVGIWQIIDSVIVSKDSYGENMALKQFNFMYSPKYNISSNKPKKITKIQISCPCAFMESGNAALSWHCRNCKEVMKSGINGYFYCQCGRSEAENYLYRCGNIKHSQYLPLKKSALIEYIEDISKTEINILVLGETGVGKSTWLNGLVNYVFYDSLEQAKAKGVQHIIPARFDVDDSNFENHVVTIGNFDSGEVSEIGDSGTQYTKSYKFRFDKLIIRIIDTPGIGDTRGLDQDKLNMQNILEHISHLDYLHGICILMKPHQTRLNVCFKFCINQLLRHLHDSARQNIVFCFTHSMATHFKPAGTLPILRTHLSEMDIILNLAPQTIYHIDNSAFRYLCSLQNPNIMLEDEEIIDYQKCWTQTVSETTRLFQHIMTVEPHQIKHTTSLNETRRLVLATTKPLADICRIITINVAKIQNEKCEIIEKLKRGARDLDASLLVRKVVVKTTPLKYPQTVCGNNKCIEHTIINDVTTTHYKLVCHNMCRAYGVIPGKFNQRSLKYCRAFNSSKTCHVCGCPPDVHLHIYTKEDIYETDEEDEIIRQKLKENKSTQKEVTKCIQELQQKTEDYLEELNRIAVICSQFNAFLETHGICAINDPFETYLGNFIEELSSNQNATTTDKHILQKLQSHLQFYNNEKRILRETGVRVITHDQFLTLTYELFQLPLTGQMFKEHLEASKAATLKAKSYMEVVINAEGLNYQKFFK